MQLLLSLQVASGLLVILVVVPSVLVAVAAVVLEADIGLVKETPLPHKTALLQGAALPHGLSTSFAIIEASLNYDPGPD